MIDGVTNADAIPALERLMQFTSRRHHLIAHNIANITTPDYQPVDVSVDAFHAQLGKAVDARREGGAAQRDLSMGSTREVEITNGGMELHPRPTGDNLLYHDGNDRSPEHMMQDLVENFMTFRTAAEFMRSRFDLINTAIRERI